MNDRLRELIRELAREVLLEAKAPVVAALEKTLAVFLNQLMAALNSRREDERVEPAAGLQTQAEARRRTISVALSRAGGNKTQAADLLGITVRTLRSWIRKYEITPYDWREPAVERVIPWAEYERAMVERLLEYYDGNKTAAAEFYGVTRKTLGALMKDRGDEGDT